MLKKRPHQKKASECIIYGTNGLIKTDRLKFISACGTGKTYTALWTTEEYLLDVKNLNTSKSVFFYPSLALVAQSFQDYKRETRIETYNPLFICSDNTIADSEDITFEELKDEVGKHKVTTCIEEIKEYLLDKETEHKVVYCTYQSSHLLAKAAMEINIDFDIGIYDEAHNIALKNNTKSSARTIILHDKSLPSDLGFYFSCKKRLFITATPKHFEINDDNDNFVSIEDTRLAYSMDDERYFGRTAHEYSMRDAINDGVIADYKIIVITIDDDYIKNFTKENNNISDNEILNSVKAFATIKAHEKYGIKKSITFEKNVLESKKTQGHLQQYSNKIKCSHIDGYMSHNKKNKIMTNFRDAEESILTNSKLLNEGVDIPSVDMVTFSTLTGSNRDIIQKVGRAQRISTRNKDKTAYILIPVVVSKIDNIGISNFNKHNRDADKLYRIINSLKETDRQLRDVLKYKVNKLSKEEYELMAMKVSELLGNKVIDKTEKNELKKLQAKIRQYEQYNQIDPIIFEDMKTLTRNTIGNRKKQKNATTFEQKEQTPKHLKILDYLNVTILGNGSIQEAKWNANFNCLQDYLKTNKKENIVLTTKHNGINLGEWLASQKRKINSNELDSVKTNKLKSLGICLSLKKPSIAIWDEYFLATKEYLAEHKISSISYFTEYKGMKIGKWVSDQKGRARNNKMSKANKIKFLRLIPNIEKTQKEKEKTSKKTEIYHHSEKWNKILDEVLEMSLLDTVQKQNDYCNKIGVKRKTRISWIRLQNKKVNNGVFTKEQLITIDKINNNLKK